MVKHVIALKLVGNVDPVPQNSERMIHSPLYFWCLVPQSAFAPSEFFAANQSHVRASDRAQNVLIILKPFVPQPLFALPTPGEIVDAKCCRESAANAESTYDERDGLRLHIASLF